MLLLLQSISKWIVLASLLMLLASLFFKDRLPDPGYFQSERLTDPVQRRTLRKPAPSSA